jgi:hypothetical protein
MTRLPPSIPQSRKFFDVSDGTVEISSMTSSFSAWEFGAAGSVIVLVSDRKATKVVHYTLDEGMSWHVVTVAAPDTAEVERDNDTLAAVYTPEQEVLRCIGTCGNSARQAR